MQLFERDRFYPMITDGFDKLLNGESPLPYKYLPQEKHIYHGAMSDKMLEKTMENYQDRIFQSSDGEVFKECGRT